MLMVALLLLLQVAVLLGIGHWVLRRGLQLPSQPLEAILLLAMGITGLLTHGLSIFFPVDETTQWLVLLIGLTAWIDPAFYTSLRQYQNRLQPLSPPEKGLLLCLILTAVTLAAGPILRDDTESYHLQNIHWIREYGTVPGLANLHSRLGFNSIWFHTTAILTPFSEYNFYTTPNTLLSLLMASALLVPFSPKLAHQTPIRLAKLLTLLGLFICWYYWRGNIQSANYDYYFTTTTVLFFLLCREKVLSRYDLLQWALMLPPILICIRPLYLPTLLFSLYALYQYALSKKYRIVFFYAIGASLTAMLFFYRNYILSGHPLYPSQLLSLTNPAWQVPIQQIDSLQQYIRHFVWPANMNGWSGWIGWIEHLYTYDLMFIVLGMLGGIINLIQIRKQSIPFPFLVGAVLTLQLALWFGISPEPRFIAGVFVVGQFLLYQNLLHLIQTPTLPAATIQKLLVVVFIFLNVGLLYGKWTRERSNYTNVIWPQALPKPESHIFTKQGIEFHIPEKWNGNWNARCYLTPLPCVYDTLPGVRPLGKKIEEGFYVEEYQKRNIP